VDHRQAQVFRAGLPRHLPKRDVVGRSVILQNQGMIDGDIGRPLFEVTDGIASHGHHVAQQVVRFCHRTCRAVDEARLDSAPGFEEGRPVGQREGPNVKGLNSPCAFFEPGFPVPPGAALLHGAGIFSAFEPSAQSLRPAIPAPQSCRDGRGGNHHEHDDQGDVRRAECRDAHLFLHVRCH
jgi:hypothetical protein